MNVLVERYQRRKYVNQPDSQMLYYVRQKSGTVRVMDINKLADAIEANSSLTAGDVKHAIEAFVEQLRLSLTQGDKVKVDGLGTFHITLSSEGAEKEKDCTVRSIRKVNVRFVADKALQLVNTSHATTRGENNVDFILTAKGDGEGDDDGNSGSGGNSGGSGEAPDPAALSLKTVPHGYYRVISTIALHVVSVFFYVYFLILNFQFSIY